MYTLILLLPALLLLLGTEYLAWDHRRMTRPLQGDHGRAQAWFDTLDASLRPDPHEVLVSHGVVPDPWAMPPRLATYLEMEACLHAFMPCLDSTPALSHVV